jgi:hypothetical protein
MTFPPWFQVLQVAFGGRSTALKPILSLVFLLLLALAALVRYNADPLIVISVLWFSGVAVAVTIASYLWFVFKDPSELRSENFLLRREEMRTIRGDSLEGAVEAEILPGRVTGGTLESLGEGHGNDR